MQPRHPIDRGIAASRDAGGRWSRTPGARRFGRDIGALLLLKLLLLVGLWAVAVHDTPRGDTAPPAVARHFGATASAPPAAADPR